MIDLIRKRKLFFTIIGGLFILALVVFLAISAQNRMSQKYSTPDLIQLAFVRGEITEEERLLYLAYALGDYEKLPAQYHGKAPWSGTVILLELQKIAMSKPDMCRLSPSTQNELRKVLKVGVECDN